MVKKVYLLRHGHIENGSEKRYLGRTDIPLDQQGIEQARMLHDYFKTIALDMVFTSPLQRCVQTAEIICKAKTIHYETVEAFSEINMGDWENVPMAQIQSAFPDLYAQRGEDMENFTPPNGESFHDVAGRAKYAFDAITYHAKGTILIVAHAGVNRMILTSILGVTINDMFSIEQPYACINELTWDEEHYVWKHRSILEH